MDCIHRVFVPPRALDSGVKAIICLIYIPTIGIWYGAITLFKMKHLPLGNMDRCYCKPPLCPYLILLYVYWKLIGHFESCDHGIKRILHISAISFWIRWILSISPDSSSITEKNRLVLLCFRFRSVHVNFITQITEIKCQFHLIFISCQCMLWLLMFSHFHNSKDLNLTENIWYNSFWFVYTFN